MAANKDDAMNMTATTASIPSKPAIQREGLFPRLWHRLTHFLREVQVELKKTSWPTRNELTKFTIVVIVTIVVVSIYLFIVDLVFGQIAGQLFHLQAPPR